MVGQLIDARQKIAARFSLVRRIGEPLRQGRNVARVLAAAQLETPARPSSVPSEDSIPDAGTHRTYFGRVRSDIRTQALLLGLVRSVWSVS